MANKRKPLPKGRRFEVLKRDKFTCQYCGRMAPDVILEIDHIKPVAEGGNNGMLNLITSCRDCNRGKGKKKLSDNQELKKQQAELVELAEKREQLEMMAEWRMELLDINLETVGHIKRYIMALTEYEITITEKKAFYSMLNQFNMAEIMDGIDICWYQYKYIDTDKIGGICYNKRKQKEQENIDRE